MCAGLRLSLARGHTPSERSATSNGTAEVTPAKGRRRRRRRCQSPTLQAITLTLTTRVRVGANTGTVVADDLFSPHSIWPSGTVTTCIKSCAGNTDNRCLGRRQSRPPSASHSEFASAAVFSTYVVADASHANKSWHIL